MNDKLQCQGHLLVRHRRRPAALSSRTSWAEKALQLQSGRPIELLNQMKEGIRLYSRDNIPFSMSFPYAASVSLDIWDFAVVSFCNLFSAPAPLLTHIARESGGQSWLGSRHPGHSVHVSSFQEEGAVYNAEEEAKTTVPLLLPRQLRNPIKIKFQLEHWELVSFFPFRVLHSNYKCIDEWGLNHEEMPSLTVHPECYINLNKFKMQQQEN